MTLKENILRLHNLDRSYKEIATELNCSKGTIAYHCSVKVREKQHNRVYANRCKLINKLKTEAGGECVICGYSKCLKALEFHHRDKSTKFKRKGKPICVALMFSHYSVDVIKQEIKKCDLICANCHRELHDKLLGE